MEYKEKLESLIISFCVDSLSGSRGEIAFPLKGSAMFLSDRVIDFYIPGVTEKVRFDAGDTYIAKAIFLFLRGSKVLEKTYFLEDLDIFSIKLIKYRSMVEEKGQKPTITEFCELFDDYLTDCIDHGYIPG